MLDLFIVQKGFLSPKVVLSKFFGLSNYKPNEKKNESPGRACPTGGYKAFSLVEMLMALLVASLLLAALAPVMTKRMSGESISVSGTGAGISPMGDCSWYVSDDSTVSLISQENECVIPSNTYSIGILMAAGGGGGGSAADGVSGSYTHTMTSAGEDDKEEDTRKTETFNFDSSVKKMRLTIAGGGGGGGGAAFYASGYDEPKSQEDCKTSTGEYFGVFIKAAHNGSYDSATNTGGKGICVSLYNPGEGRTGSPDFPSSVESRCKAGVNSGNITSGYCKNVTACTTNANCCWTGVTSSSCDTNGANGNDYNSCNRAVCQWSAAKAICDNWQPLGANGPSGRLPSNGELAGWETYINKISNNITGILNKKGSRYLENGATNTSAYATTNTTFPGLQLCDYTANFGAARCIPGSTRCRGVFDDHCHPSHLWSSQGEGNAYYNYYLNNGAFTYNALNTHTYAFSVRCVLAQTSQFNSYSGGGGSSGASVTIEIPEAVLSAATKDGTGRVIMMTGAGGKGGSHAASSGGSATKGTNGTSTRVEIQDSTGTRIWFIDVPGGLGGNQGVVSGESGTFGTGGIVNTAQCRVYDKTTAQEGDTSAKPYDCASISIDGKGSKGIEGSDGKENGDTDGGKNPITGTYGQGGGSIACENKESCPVSKDGRVLYGKGGFVKIETATSYPGAGGGGGAAGGMIHFTRIPVDKGDNIEVVVGAGGNGGYAGAAGAKGGDTIVVIKKEDGTERTRFIAYGGPGGEAAVSGNVSTSLTPKSGKGGHFTSSSSMYSIGNGINGVKYDLFPSTNTILSLNKNTDGQNGYEPTTSELATLTTAPGGNGGINTEISSKVPNDAESGKQGIPCGGMSVTGFKFKTSNGEEINWECGTGAGGPQFAPTTPKRGDIGTFEQSMITRFPGGSTGGGGGAWHFGEGAGGGAKGMGGYVYVYYGKFEGEE